MVTGSFACFARAVFDDTNGTLFTHVTHSEFIGDFANRFASVPSIPAVGEPFRFNMQEKKTASFALVDDESLDPTGLFKKQTVIDLIK